jgi:hypothetical protein
MPVQNSVCGKSLGLLSHVFGVNLATRVSLLFSGPVVRVSLGSRQKAFAANLALGRLQSRMQRRGCRGDASLFPHLRDPEAYSGGR